MTLSDLEWLSKIFDDTKHRAASLRQQSYLSRLYQKKLSVAKINRVRRVAWCRSKLSLFLADGEVLYFQMKLEVVIDNNKAVYVWRKASKIWRPQCLSNSGSVRRGRITHSHGIVRECCKGDDASLRRSPKFDPPPTTPKHRKRES